MFERLKELRKSSNTTCDEMANLLGLKTKGAYSKKETGNVPFSLIEAKLISVHFNKSIEDIFFEDEVSY